MDEVKIRIYKVLKEDSKELFRNSPNIHDCESFSFDELTRFFRMLYPDCLIQYSIF